MTREKLTTGLMMAALLPALGGLMVSCEDEPATTTPPPPPATTAGVGGAAPAAGAPGGAGGMGGTSTPPAAAMDVEVNEDVNGDRTWDKPVYVLKKKIYVVNNAKLTIAPGTKVVGDAAALDKAALIVSRGSQLHAKGTKEKPIVFTSSSAEGSRKGGDWAGVALLGAARINTGMPCPGSTDASCKEAGIEGIPATELKAKFGGTDDASSCGELNYVRVEFAGAELEPGRELNGLTFGGCGSGTKVSYVQVHRGTDDGIEAFGGKVGFDHVVLSGNEDDSLDWDYGWSGQVQFLVIHQRAGIGDNGIEAAGAPPPQPETAEPRAQPTLFNVTMIGREGGGRAITFKEGTRGKLSNFIFQGWKGDVVDFQAKMVDLSMEWPMFLSIDNSLFFGNGNYSDETGVNAMMQSNDDDKGFDDKAAVENADRKNKLDVDPGLTAVTDVAPNYVPAAAAAGPFGTPTFGDTAATYAGAFKPGDPAWTVGWTAFPAN
jgi:hypothetical protein